MSKVIDNAVVSMQFQNEDFEKGVSQSLSTLEKLQTALNATSDKGLKELEKTDLSRLGKNIEKLKDRFSVLGAKIYKIKDTIFNLAAKPLNFAIGGIIEGGRNRAMNIEKARFSLEALLGEENQDRVDSVMKDVSASVDQTRFGLDEAAKAAATLVATGRRASDEGGLLLNDLKAIVGVASMTNSEFEDIADIFTTIAGRNKVLGTDFNRLASRGLNAAETMADYMRKVFTGEIQDVPAQAKKDIMELTKGIESASQITGTFVRELVTNKKRISFDVVAASMENAFSEAAFKANDTWEGSIANLKSAFARIGEGFYAPLVKKNSEVIRLFNALREKVNEFKDTLVFNDKLGNEFALTKQLSDSVLNFAGRVADFVKKIDVLKIMELFYNTVEIVKNVFKALWSYAKPFFEGIKAAFGKTTILDVLISITRKLEEITSYFILTDDRLESIKKLFKGIGDTIKSVIGFLNRFISGIFGINRTRSSPLMETSNGFLDIADSVGESLSSFARFISESEAVNRALEVMTTYGSKVVNFFKNVSKHIGDFIGKIKASSIFQSVYGVLTNVFNFAKANIMPVLKTVFGYLMSGFNYIKSIAGPVLSEIGSIINEVITRFKTQLPNLSGNTTRSMFGNNTNSFLDSAINIFNKIKLFISTLKDVILEHIGKSLAKANEGFETFAGENGYVALAVKRIKDLAESFVSLEWVDLSKWTKSIKDFFSGIQFGSSQATYTIDEYSDSVATLNNANEDLVSMNAKPFDAGNFLDGIVKFYNIVVDIFKNKIIPFFKNKDNISLLASGGFLFVLGKSLFGLINFLNGGTKILNRKVDAFLKIFDIFFNGSNGFFMGIKKVFESGSKGFLESFKSLTDAIELVPKAINKEIKSKAFLNYAVGITLLAAAFGLLALKVDPEKLLKVGLAIGFAMIPITLCLGIISKYGDENKMKFFAASLISLAASILIIVLSLKLLFDLEIPDNADVKLLMIGAIFAAMYFVISTIKPTQGDSAKLMTFIGIALLLYSIINSLERIFKLQIPADLEDKLTVLAGVILSLIGVIWMVMHNDVVIAGGTSILLTLIGVALVLWALTNTLERVLKLEIPQDWIDKLKLYAGLIVALCVVILAIGFAAKIAAAGSFSGFGLTLIGAALFLWVLTNTLMKVMKMEIPDDWLAKLGLFTLLIGALCLVILAIGFAGKISGGGLKAGGTILALTLFLAVLTLSLAFLSLFDWDKLLGGAVALGVVFVALGITLSLASKVQSPVWAELLVICFIIIEITGALIVLTYMNFKMLITAALSLGGVFLAIGFALSCAGKITSWTGFASLVTMVVLIAAVCLAFLAINKEVKDWQKLIAIAGSIALVFASLSVIIGIVAFAIKLLAGVDFISGLKAILLVMLGVAGVIIAAALGLLGAIAIFAAAMNNPTVSKFLEGAVDFFALIGRAFGAMVDAFMTTATQNLDQLGTRLSDFYTNAKPFFDGLNNIEDGAPEKAKAFAGAIASITASNLIDGISSFILGNRNMAAFGVQIKSLADSLVTFSDKVSGIDPGDIEKGMRAIKTIVSVAKEIPNTGGAISILTGNNDIGPFIQQLNSEVCGNIKTLGKSMAKIPDGIDKKAEDLKTIFKSLVELGKAIPNTGGAAQGIFGDKNKGFAAFGAALSSVAPGIEAYAVAISKVDAGTAQASVGIAQVIVEMMDSFSSLSLIHESNFTSKMNTFTTWLGSFGTALSTFYEKIKEIDTQRIALVNRAILSISELADADFLALGEINTTLQNFANDGIKSFINAFDNSHENGRKAIQYFINEAIKPIMDKANTDKMVSYGTRFAEYFLNGFTAVNTDKIANASTRFTNYLSNKLNVKENMDKFINSGKNAGAGFVQGFNSKLDEAKKASENFGKTVKDGVNDELGIKSPSTELMWSGGMTIDGFITGFENSKGEAIKSIDEFGSSVKGRLVENVEEAKTEAMNSASGFGGVIGNVQNEFMNGISEKQDDFMGKFNENLLSSIDTEGFMNKQNEFTEMFNENLLNSIDTEGFMNKQNELGDMFNENLLNSVDVEGFKQKQNELMNSFDMGPSSFMNTDQLLGDMNLQPTITPVVDLTNVQQSSNDIASMFNNGMVQANLNHSGYINQGLAANDHSQISQMMQQYKYDDSKLIEQMTNLNNNVFGLSQKVDHMQVILDSGTLVGEITPMIDASLGRRINRQSRL